MPPFDREAALKSGRKALEARQGRRRHRRIRQGRRGPAARLEQRQQSRRSVRARRSSSRRVSSSTRASPITSRKRASTPKAAALFKKILKLKPDDEYALLQSGDLAAKQGTLADAKQYFLQRRRTPEGAWRQEGRSRGQRSASARSIPKISIRVSRRPSSPSKSATRRPHCASTATWPRARETGEARRRAGAASSTRSTSTAPTTTIRRQLFAAYLETNTDLAAQGGAAASASSRRSPRSSRRPAGRCDARGPRASRRARSVPISRCAPGSRWRMSARRSRQGALVSVGGDGRQQPRAVDHARRNRTARGQVAGRPRGDRAGVVARSQPDAGRRSCSGAGSRSRIRTPAISPIDAVADAALATSDFAAAAVALHEFTTRVRSHLVALMRLVEICVDGGLEATMSEAQAALADALSRSGPRDGSADHQRRPGRARAVESRQHRSLPPRARDARGARSRRDHLGSSERRKSPFLATEKIDLNEGVTFDAPPPSPPVRMRRHLPLRR